MADEDKIKYSDIIQPDDSIEKLVNQLGELNKSYETMVNAIRAGADRRDKTFYSVDRIENPDNFERFKEELDKLGDIEHEITIFTENFEEFENPFSFENLCDLWFLMDK